MDLFEHHRDQLNQKEAPLAARLRPQTLDEFIGQDHIVGQGRLLRRAIQADQLSSLIFSGPPGTGKTTLAQVIANTTQAHFITLNAVLAGVKEIRSAIDTAKERRGQHGQRTILFVDEVHRFNKAQQDALLPWVENGTIILIGATTENPFFEVNPALVSRSRIFQLQPLSPQHLHQVIHQALTDPERGYGSRRIQINPDAAEHLVNVANGDARSLLNALELAVETTEPTEGTIQITLAIAEESIQQRAVLYDKEGDAHFDTISAFIKSVRGSDPDAALYWLARMFYAGENPRFIFRRMLILASEDIGLADSQAVVVVNACADAFERMGLPEGHYPLAQAALYLATAPKSNSVMGFFDALNAVKQQRTAAVPNHLKDGNRDKTTLGHGADYKYPHAYREHWVAQQYLPSPLQGQIFYQPSDQGEEASIRDRWSRLREAQWASLLELENNSSENWTFSPADASQDRWIQRTQRQLGMQLASVRDQVFKLARLLRHSVVLDLYARKGLFTWEALREAPEGGVYAWVQTPEEAATLEAQMRQLSPIQRPMIIQSPLETLVSTLIEMEPGLRLDCILARNLFTERSQDAEYLTQLARLLDDSGKIVLAESVPRCSQRICDLLAAEAIGKALYSRWQATENHIYESALNPQLAWKVEPSVEFFQSRGFRVNVEQVENNADLYVSASLIDRWFATNPEKPSYADYLRMKLSDEDVAKIQTLLTQRLLNQTVQWRHEIAYMTVTHNIKHERLSV